MSNSEPLYIDTQHGRLAYRENGLGSAPPLVVAQRFRGTMDDWDPRFVENLSDGRRVIRFDSTGIGLSGGSVPNSVEGMAEVALSLAGGLGLGEFDLLGWSLGGYVAQSLALNAPGRVRRLIIAGSGPGGVSEGPPPHPHVGEIALNEALSRDDLLFLFSAGTPSGRASMAVALERVDKARTGSPAVSIEAATRQRVAIGKWWRGEDAARARLGELTLPVLVANGVKDIMVPAMSSFIISQEAPNAKLVLYPDSGHGFLFQEADAFAREVTDFLS